MDSYLLPRTKACSINARLVPKPPHILGQMLDETWNINATRKKILKYAIEEMSRSIVIDVIDQAVDKHEVETKRREEILLRREREANIGYRKLRPMDVFPIIVRNPLAHAREKSGPGAVRIRRIRTLHVL